MKRHPGLHALSQHHHFALTQSLLMRRAAEAPASHRAEKLRRAAQSFLRFWRNTGQVHFQEEEEVLLPAFARQVRLDQEPAVMRMLAEHAEIRARIQELETSLEQEADLDNIIAALARQLQDHVRREENEIFPRIESVLGEESLQALGRRLTRLHPKKTCGI